MATPVATETTVTGGYLASIPATVRRRLGIEAGDKLVWELQGGKLRVRVRKRRSRGFSDFVPFDAGRPTNATVELDEIS
jgi:bifunctional DNA-binding transcriptional regulator/antitoxin component of YhaV-PrlF toxin-antitoxin module